MSATGINGVAKTFFDDISLTKVFLKSILNERCPLELHLHLFFKCFAKLCLNPKLFSNVTQVQTTLGYEWVWFVLSGRERSLFAWQRCDPGTLPDEKVVLWGADSLAERMRMPPMCAWVRQYLTLMLLVANLANTKLCKSPENDRNPDIWVLIWKNSPRAFQWIPTW